MLVFTRDGHMSVQVMDRNAQAREGAGPNQYSQNGYEASYGTYVTNQNTRTLTFHVDGALVRTLVGKSLLRAYKFSGNRLLVTSTRVDEHWRVTWERYALRPN
jgi:hypothetical protein